jgi:lipopolysaccharide transport system ATP-binding protein
MNELAIKCESLSKLYYLGNKNNIFEWLFSRGKNARQQELLWALKDVSFEIKSGEVVGIIGKNGAGKSTILKLLTGITAPSKGKATVYGRIGSLLEVGTGFHPELTGRENIFLNGAILGMTRKEINQNLEEIIAFSEIEKFIDTPVKRYSSGMYTRLAFAVSAHLQSEVLLIDEILAVGDVAFQKKCLGKMADIGKQGRTVIFVSHNMGAISELCSRCLFFDKGDLAYDGSPKEAIQRYLENSKNKSVVQVIAPPREEDKPVYVTKIGLKENRDGDYVSSLELFQEGILEIEYTIEEKVHNLCMAVLVTYENVPLLYSYDIDKQLEDIIERSPGNYKAQIKLPTTRFKEGNYVIEVKIGQNNINLTDERCVFSFSIENNFVDTTHKSYRKDRPGLLSESLVWETIKMTEM